MKQHEDTSAGLSYETHPGIVNATRDAIRVRSRRTN
jgi:hypothetical protein